jgi:hypothetical protein
VYACIHSEPWTNYSSHLEFYSDPTVLTVQERLELEWWLLALPTGLQENVVSKVAGNLGVAWGDGSGTDTGGMLEWVGPDSGPLPHLETLMGIWKPSIASPQTGVN